jgi:hypothetical protein
MPETQLFRLPPSLELTERFIKHLGLTGIDDSRQLCRNDIPLDGWGEIFSDLYPYYYPSKAEFFLQKDLTPRGLMYILRHLIRRHGYDLQTTEKKVAGKKVYFYSIIKKLKAIGELTADDFFISFD